MFRNKNSPNRLESENKQLKLQLETTLDQARQFQNMMQFHDNTPTCSFPTNVSDF